MIYCHHITIIIINIIIILLFCLVIGFCIGGLQASLCQLELPFLSQSILFIIKFYTLMYLPLYTN